MIPFAMTTVAAGVERVGVVGDVAMCAYGAVFDAKSGVWLSDAVGITIAYKVASSGMVSGVRLYELCLRAELRLCALDAAVAVEQCAREAVYVDTVRMLEEGLRLLPLDYLAYARQFELVSQLYTSAAPPQSARLMAVESVPVGFRVVPSSSVAVLTTSADSVVDKSLLPKGLVIPQMVYAGFLSLAHSVDGPVSVRVGFVRRMDGVYQLLQNCDASAMVSYSQLPQGDYALPGVGCIVNRAVIIAHLEQVFVVPHLVRTDGYCYVSVLPPELRVVVAARLGRDVTAAELRASCPSVRDWAACDAALTQLEIGGELSNMYHVDAPGNLPRWLEDDASLGAYGNRWSEAPSGAPRLPVFPPRPDLDSHVDSRFAQMMSRQSGSSLQQPVPMRPGSRSDTPSFVRALAPPAGFEPRSRGGSFGGTVSPFTVDVRAASLPATGWQVVDDPGVEEWIQRLSSGAPVGHAALRALTKAKPGGFPALFAALGRVVVVPPVDAGVGGKELSWSGKNIQLPGWSAEYTTVRTEGWYYAVPLVPNIWTRYEFSFSKELSVNGITLPGRRTAVWANGPIVLRYHGGDAHLWRMVSNTGVGMLGPEFAFAGRSSLLMVRDFQSRGFTADEASVLKLKSHSPGPYSMYSTVVKVPSGTTAVLLVFGDVEPPGCARVAVRAAQLNAVIVHGAVIPARAGVVECVMLARQLVVAVSVMGHNVEVLFEVSCDAPQRRQTVALNRMLPAPPSAEYNGGSPVLPP